MRNDTQPLTSAATASALPKDEGAYLLTETLLDTAWQDVNDMWQLGANVTASTPGNNHKTWGEFKTASITAISQQLLEKKAVDSDGHAKFLAGLLLQRARPELFLKDSGSVTKDYARDPAAITLRWAARLCDAVSPRAGMALTVEEVVATAEDIAKQAGNDVASGEVTPDGVISSGGISGANTDEDDHWFSELSGQILGEEVAATARAWGYQNATEWLELTREAEDKNQQLLVSLEHKEAPDLRQMASATLRARGYDPDGLFKVVNVIPPLPFEKILVDDGRKWGVRRERLLNLDAFLIDSMKGSLVDERNAVVQRYTTQAVDYEKAHEPIVKGQLEILLQNLSPEDSHDLNTGRWRVFQMSSRNAEMFKLGVLAVIEIKPGSEGRSHYHSVMRDRSGNLVLFKEAGGAHSGYDRLAKRDFSWALRMLGNGINVALPGNTEYRGGLGLEPGEWHDGKNTAELSPFDPKSTAHEVAQALMAPVWNNPFAWEVDFAKEQSSLSPWERDTEKFSWMSLIPFYEYFSKPIAERGGIDHIGAALELGSTLVPGLKGGVSAGRAISGAVGAGLKTTVSAGMKNGLFSLGQRIAITSAGGGARRTVIGGLWQTVQGMGRSVSVGLADQAFRKGLRKGGVHLAYATGECSY